MKKYFLSRAATALTLSLGIPLVAVPVARAGLTSETLLSAGENIFDYLRQGGPEGDTQGRGYVTITDWNDSKYANYTQQLRLTGDVVWKHYAPAAQHYQWDGWGNLSIDGLDPNTGVKHTIDMIPLYADYGILAFNGWVKTIHDISILNSIVTFDSKNTGGVNGKDTYYGLFEFRGNGAAGEDRVNFYLSGTEFRDFDNYAYYGGSVFGGNGFESHFFISGDKVNGVGEGVKFINNYNRQDGGGVIGMDNYLQVTLSGKIEFINNTSYGWGGAISYQDAAWLKTTTNSDILFKGNYNARFGGAIDVWGYGVNGSTSVAGLLEFAGKTVFDGNYVHSDNTTTNESRGARGGALNVGNEPGKLNIEFKGETKFVNNYVENFRTEATKTQYSLSLGGAICVFSSTGGYYNLHLPENVLFEGNYVHSKNGYAYGGAIFYTSAPTSAKQVRLLEIKAGSQFINNYAGSELGANYGFGGAICVVNGTVTIWSSEGLDTVFQGNRHGVSFIQNAQTGKMEPDPNSGSLNAIFFARPYYDGRSSLVESGENANAYTGGKLHLKPRVNSAIHFYDPIMAKSGVAGRNVQLKLDKLRRGDVIFYDHRSDVEMPVEVQAGRMILRRGAIFGAMQNSPLTVKTGGEIVIEQGSEWLSSSVTIEDGGRIFTGKGVTGPWQSNDTYLKAQSIVFNPGGGVGGEGILNIENSSGNSIVIQTKSVAEKNNPSIVHKNFVIEVPVKDTEFELVPGISGPGQVVKRGPGLFVMSEKSVDSNYSGGTLVEEGIVRILNENLTSYDAKYWTSSRLLGSGGVSLSDGGFVLTTGELQHLDGTTNPNGSEMRIQPNENYKADYIFDNPLAKTPAQTSEQTWERRDENLDTEHYVEKQGTTFDNIGYGVLRINLASKAVEKDAVSGQVNTTDRYKLTFTKSTKDFDARIWVRNLDLYLKASTSHTDDVYSDSGATAGSSLNNAKLEVGDNTRLFVPAGVTHLGSLKFKAPYNLSTSNPVAFASADIYLRFADISASPQTPAGKIIQNSESMIDVSYALTNGQLPSYAPKSNAGVLDFNNTITATGAQNSNMGTIYIQVDSANGGPLDSLFQVNSMPLLLRDDYGLPRTLIKANTVRGDVSKLELVDYQKNPISRSDSVTYNDSVTGEDVALQNLTINTQGLTTGPNNDGLYISAHLDSIEIAPGKYLTLRPAPHSAEFPDIAVNREAKHNFTTPITNLSKRMTGTTGNPDVDAFDMDGNVAPGGVAIEASGSYVALTHSQHSYCGTTDIRSGELRASTANVLAKSRQLHLSDSAGTDAQFNTGVTIQDSTGKTVNTSTEQTINRLAGGGTIMNNNAATMFGTSAPVVILDNSPWNPTATTDPNPGDGQAGIIGLLYTDPANPERNISETAATLATFLANPANAADSTNPTANTTFSGRLAGTGDYEKTGIGALSLTGAHNFEYSNKLTIKDGTVNLEGSGRLGGIYPVGSDPNTEGVYVGQITLHTGSTGAPTNPAFSIGPTSTAHQYLRGSVVFSGDNLANARVVHQGKDLTLLGDPNGTLNITSNGPEGYIQALTIGGGTQNTRLSGNGTVGELTVVGATSPLASSFDASALPTPHVVFSPGDEARVLNHGSLDEVGATGTLVFGTDASSVTTLHNVKLELDLGFDDALGNSDRIILKGTGQIGQFVIDISHVTGTWNSGLWEILTADNPLLNYDGSALLTTNDLKDNVKFLWHGSTRLPTAMADPAEVKLGNNGTSLFLQLQGLPHSLIWNGKSGTDGNGNRLDIWEYVPDGLRTVVQAPKDIKNWVDVHKQDFAHTPTVISMFNASAAIKGANNPVRVEGHNRTYAMEVLQTTTYVFDPLSYHATTHQPEASIEISPTSYIHGTYGDKEADMGSMLKVATGSKATFNLPFTTPGVVALGEIIFNYDLNLGAKRDEVRQEYALASPKNPVLSNLTTKQIEENLDSMFTHNGQIDLSHANTSAKVTIGANLIVNLGANDGPNNDGIAEIKLGPTSTLTFSGMQTTGNYNFYGNSAQGTDHQYDSYDITHVRIIGDGKIVRTGNNIPNNPLYTTFEGDTRIGTRTSALGALDETFVTGAQFDVNNGGAFHFHQNAPTGGSLTTTFTGKIGTGQRDKNIGVGGILSKDSRNAAAPAILSFDENTNILTNDFSTYQGDIYLRNGATMRLEGRLGVITETFDDYPKSPMPSRYQHGVFEGKVEFDPGTTFEFARDIKTSSATVAYDTIGSKGGIKMTEAELGETLKNKGKFLWVTNSNYQAFTGTLASAQNPQNLPVGTFRHSGNSAIHFSGDATKFSGTLLIENGIFNFGPKNPALNTLGGRTGSQNQAPAVLTVGSSNPADTRRPTFSVVGGNLFLRELNLHSNATLRIGSAKTPSVEINMDTSLNGAGFKIEPKSTVVLHLGAALIATKNGNTNPNAKASMNFSNESLMFDAQNYTTGKINLEILPAYTPAANETEFLLMENVALSNAITANPLTEIFKTDIFKFNFGEYQLRLDSPAGRLYLQQLSFNPAGIAIPEPSTYALIGSISTLLLALYRRHRTRHRTPSSPHETLKQRSRR